MLRTDIHTHLLPGVDDGSRSPVETIAMARGLAELGVERVYLTPHNFKLSNRLSPLEVKRGADNTWRTLARAGVSIEVRPGAEYYYGEELLDALSRGEELIPLDVDGEAHLLVELPLHQRAIGVRRVGEAILRRNMRPVLAHPERTAGVLHEIDRVHDWVAAGWLLQLNLPSLLGRYGASAREAAHILLAEGLYAFAGSDLHRPAELEGLRHAHAAFRELTEGVPQQ